MTKPDSDVLNKEVSLELIADNEETLLDLSKRQTYVIDTTKDNVTIGRDVGSDIRISLESDVGRTISRYHAILRMSKGICYIEDNESKNGTFVNGRKITESTPLNEGDKVGLGGKVTLKYHTSFRNQ